MSETSIIATNEDAEKLWSYILAYKRRLHAQKEDSPGNNLTISAIPLEEEIVAKTKN